MKAPHLLLALLGTVACAPPTPEISGPINPDWALNTLWDDGLAEVAKYQAERIVYNKVRTFDYDYILVKEDFNREFQTKTDDYTRSDLFPVMKVNKFARIATENYPYQYLTSLFFRRENPSEIYKLTTTSQEWCGNTSKSFINQKRRYQFEYSSYWDGQGNGMKRVPIDPWFEDQLSYTLRGLRFAEGLTFEKALFPTQVTNKATLPEAVNANFTVRRADSEEVTGVDSTLVSNPWRVDIIKANGETMKFWFNDSYPNYLLKMESSDGQKLLLKKLSRYTYWLND